MVRNLSLNRSNEISLALSSVLKSVNYVSKLDQEPAYLAVEASSSPLSNNLQMDEARSPGLTYTRFCSSYYNLHCKRGVGSDIPI